MRLIFIINTATKDNNNPIIGGASNKIDPNQKPYSGGSSSSNSGGGGSININPNGNGGVSIKGSDINIGGGSGSGNMGSGFNNNNRDLTCLNGGRRPMAGLPCSCPIGFSGLRCEYASGSLGSNNWPYNNVQGYCSSYPCQNGGVRNYILIISLAVYQEIIVVFYRLYRNVRREPLVTFANVDTTFMDLDANIVRIFRVF